MKRAYVVLVGLAVLLGGGLAWQHACQGPATPLRPGSRSPNFIVIVIDTLRADMLAGPDGAPREMPYARELARRGVLFTDVSAPAPWTLPSMGSLLTGLPPRDHGVTRMVPMPLLPSAVRTWAEVLREAGYQTAAYSGAPWLLQGEQGLFKGFSSGEDRFGLDAAPRRLQPWRRGLNPSRPFFLLLHTFEAHDPYGEEDNRYTVLPPQAPPGFDPLAVREPWAQARSFMLSRGERQALERTYGPGFAETVMRYLWSGYRHEPRPELAAELRQAYVEGVRWVDGLLRTTAEWLESERLLDNTVLVVTSDHGEAFGEHGTLEHGRILHEEVLRVPLVVLGPEPWRGGRVVQGHVGLMDLMPTLAEMAGVVAPPGAVGRSLEPLLRGAESQRQATAEEVVDFTVSREDIELRLRSVRTARYAVILEWDLRRGTLREHAYDRSVDPLETRDLAGGRGTLEGLTLDPETCKAVDALRAELVAEGMTARLPPPCGR